MTVVNAMRFNPQEAAIIADERSSNSMRMYDYANKLRTYDGEVKVAFAGSGATDILDAIARHTLTHLSNRASENHPAQILAYEGQNVRGRALDDRLQSTFHISEPEFQIGQKIMPDGSRGQIDPSLMQRYQQIIEGMDPQAAQYLSFQFLMLSVTNGSVELSMTSSNSGLPTFVESPYRTAGSGGDSADNEIYSFIERFSREERENIDPNDGLATLLNATAVASRRNAGVGGTPQIAIVKTDGIITPTSDNTRLAGEVVTGERAGLLPTGFRREALDTLLYKQDDFKAVEDTMFKQASDAPQLSRLLRGYK